VAARISLRRADVADAPAITDVFVASRNDAVPRIPRMRHSVADTRHWFEAIVLVEQEVWVAEVDGAIAAMMVLRGDSLDHLYVRPGAQRRGVGSQLLQHAKRRRPHGLRLYTFEANEPARDFYEKHGFKAIAFGDGTGNEEGAPDVLYEWRGLLR
jgi:ribosomal protein S18 acetylase RimI-like enzyme